MSQGIRAGESAEGENPAERACRLASHYNDAGRPELAEREASRGLAIEPENLDLHFQVARSQFARSQWDEAEQSTQRLLALAPDSPVGLQMLVMVRMHQGSYYEAEQIVLEALSLAPNWARLYELYGDLMRLTAHDAKAVRLYERARQLDPEDADIHAKLAMVEAGRNRHGEAEIHARHGLGIDPSEALAHASLGNTMLQRGRPFAARTHFREALRLDPHESSYEAAWLEADRCCRVVYLPMYYWSLILSRLPGRQFFVWGLFIAFIALGKQLGVPDVVVGIVTLLYLAMCIYTWLATLMLKLWLKIRPPDLGSE